VIYQINIITSCQSTLSWCQICSAHFMERQNQRDLCLC